MLCNDLKGKVLMEFWRRHLCGQTPAGSYVLILEAMIKAEDNSLTIKKGYEKMLAYVLNYSTALPHGYIVCYFGTVQEHIIIFDNLR